MNFEYSEKEKSFRKEVKDWLNQTLPKSLSEKVKKYQRLTNPEHVVTPGIFVQKVIQIENPIIETNAIEEGITYP